ncbi:GntR family transcriptional regulator [Kineosporia sp. J2-2]|uniref:GntR family transcriptional regulator n=1 Tax=Kineosporia corallincola TaxID=2835133 RepID=A0ABS5TCI0_9ACTN|nr:GntR family transcriptional regulator [Kineosporia corallincola]MBT0768783.1 GntR family transcriptional regulator [Kineosporia corallincola]
MPISPYRHIADEIVARIVAGHHRPGTLLPSPGDLEHQGYPIGAARDALRWLVRHGWAEARPGTGYHVTDDPPVAELDWAAMELLAEEHVQRYRRGPGGPVS